AGLWVAEPSWQAGLSGELKFDAASMSPSWPATLCLELRGMPLAVPFVASAALILSAGPGSSPSWNLGLGIGLIF
ncbi:MAG TPA: hypothetical protein VFL04_07280, partial [Rectinemataceae bacterium]|nr:hypothetical protein [Rectinemataceae bacterium]